MPLKVASFASYLSSIANDWEDADFAAYKFVRAIKGDKVNGHAKVPVNGSLERLDETTQPTVYQWFADWAIKHLPGQQSSKIALVPVPGHDATKPRHSDFPAARMATALAARAGAANRVVVADLLRWKSVKTPSHQGGPRDPQVLLPNLAVHGKKLDGYQYVLIDDVYTSGGHLKACTAALADLGISVELALCAGRCVREQVANRFNIPAEELEDFESEIPGYQSYLIYVDAVGTRWPGFLGYASLWLPNEARGRLSGLLVPLKKEHDHAGPIAWSDISPTTINLYLKLVDEFFSRNWLMFHALIAPAPSGAAQPRSPDELIEMLLKAKVRQFATGAEPKAYRVRIDRGEATEPPAPLDFGGGPIKNVIDRTWASCDGVQLAALLLDAVLSDWSRSECTPSQTAVRRRIAERLGWDDLSGDTHLKVWKFNIWTYFNPKKERRPVQTRPVPAAFQAYRRQ